MAHVAWQGPALVLSLRVSTTAQRTLRCPLRAFVKYSWRRSVRAERLGDRRDTRQSDELASVQRRRETVGAVCLARNDTHAFAPAVAVDAAQHAHEQASATHRSDDGRGLGALQVSRGEATARGQRTGKAHWSAGGARLVPRTRHARESRATSSRAAHLRALTPSCSLISSTRLALPSHVASPSNGCTMAPLRSAQTFSANAFASAHCEPCTVTLAPYDSRRARTNSGVDDGTHTSHGRPSARAAYAAASPALPPELDTISLAPAALAAAHVAPMPRSLNDPEGCAFSSLSITSRPIAALSASERTSGVSTCSRSGAAARAIARRGAPRTPRARARAPPSPLRRSDGPAPRSIRQRAAHSTCGTRGLRASAAPTRTSVRALSAEPRHQIASAPCVKHCEHTHSTRPRTIGGGGWAAAAASPRHIGGKHSARTARAGRAGGGRARPVHGGARAGAAPGGRGRVRRAPLAEHLRSARAARRARARPAAARLRAVARGRRRLRGRRLQGGAGAC